MKNSSTLALVTWGCLITTFLICGCNCSTLRRRNQAVEESAIEEVTQAVVPADTTLAANENPTDRVDGESSTREPGLQNAETQSSSADTEGGSASGEEKVEEPNVKPPSATALPGEDETTDKAQAEDSDSDSSSSSSESDSSSEEDETESDEGSDEESSSDSNEDNLKKPSPAEPVSKLKGKENLSPKPGHITKTEKTGKFAKNNRSSRKEKLALS